MSTRIYSGGSTGTSAVGVAMAVRTRCRGGNWAVKALVAVVTIVTMMVVKAVMQQLQLSRGNGDSDFSDSSSVYCLVMLAVPAVACVPKGSSNFAL